MPSRRLAAGQAHGSRPAEEFVTAVLTEIDPAAGQLTSRAPICSPRSAQVIRAVTRAGCPRGLCLVTTDQRPSDIQNYTGLRDTPLILGAVLALLAAGTLAHVLLTGVRRRRRDLAVLKTLGLLRSQLLRVVSWQASALAAAALLVGRPVGLLAGRWAWALFAGSVGVAGTAEVPLPIVLLVIPVTLLVASLLAAGPGWAAARIRPALILRAE